jgi:hypothetical protein
MAVRSPHQETTMLRLLLSICALIATSSWTQAGVVPALNANFNADIVGQAPDASLPGEPVGDQIAFSGSNINTVHSGSGEMSDQPLRIAKGGSGGLTRFKIVPEYRGCEAFVLQWTVMIEDFQASTTFTLRNTNSNTMAVMGFQSNRFWTGAGYAPIYPDMGVASAIDKAFTFEMRLNRTTNLYSMSVNGNPIPEMQDYPLGGGEFDRIEVAFGGNGSDYVYVDDITISADCSFVSTENTSWGSLKSRY